MRVVHPSAAADVGAPSLEAEAVTVTGLAKSFDATPILRGVAVGNCRLFGFHVSSLKKSLNVKQIGIYVYAGIGYSDREKQNRASQATAPAFVLHRGVIVEPSC